jgi:polyhydroxyalkanoate synthesis regulator phasin
MEDPIQRAVDISVGAVARAKEALEGLAADLTERGRAARSASAGRDAQGRARGRTRRDSIKEIADEEMHRVLTKARIATARDIARIEDRLAQIEARLSKLEGAPPGDQS